MTSAMSTCLRFNQSQEGGERKVNLDHFETVGFHQTVADLLHCFRQKPPCSSMEYLRREFLAEYFGGTRESFGRR